MLLEQKVTWSLESPPGLATWVLGKNSSQSGVDLTHTARACGQSAETRLWLVVGDRSLVAGAGDARLGLFLGQRWGSWTGTDSTCRSGTQDSLLRSQHVSDSRGPTCPASTSEMPTIHKYRLGWRAPDDEAAITRSSPGLPTSIF